MQVVAIDPSAAFRKALRMWLPRTAVSVDAFHLADTTVRASYDSAMARIRESRQLPLVVSDRPVVPERIEWLHSEMLKTRVAHGYCSRHLAAEACPYANICEQCDLDRLKA